MAWHKLSLHRAEAWPQAQDSDIAVGNGVHIPVFAPHWMRNHDNISVAVSVNYELRSTLSEKRTYQVNRLMRRLGIAPAAKSPWRDRLKLAAADSLMSPE
jgi:hypothetical protein